MTGQPTVGRPDGTVAPPVLLASASASRRRMLAAAGLAVTAEAAAVDEEEVKLALQAEGAGNRQVAETLAELKAQRLSSRHGSMLVIGADQVLECDGRLFDKPRDLVQAADHLRALSGRSHDLISCVCVVRDGQRIWHHHDRARLVVRPLSEAFIADYLAAVGARALESVGAYQLEGLGAQLFTRVEGDYFTVLGLPLLPLLGFLRSHGVVPT